VFKTLITDLNELKQRLSTEWTKLDRVVMVVSWRQPFVSGVVDSSSSVMRVWYTFFCNISHMLLSTEFKSAEF